MIGRMRVALVHEWLVSRAGSEQVLAAMAECFPEAPIFTLVHDERATRGTEFEKHPIHTSWLQRLPGVANGSGHRRYLPLMPMAVESLDVRGFDVVVSSSHAVAKGVLTRADQLHISYVHTPARYAWDLFQEHLNPDRQNPDGSPPGIRLPSGLGIRSLMVQGVMHYFRGWDFAAAQRVDVMVANSRYVARRIGKTYRREAEVVYPPVDVERFAGDPGQAALGPHGRASGEGDFYLVVSRLVPYKRVGLIAEAFTRLGKRLVVIGDGPERGAVQKIAGPSVSLMGELDDAAVADHMRRCKALVIAADEDFGITAVEALAAGSPVIAYGKGGVAETVTDGETGVLFGEQSVASLMSAVERFEGWYAGFDSGLARERAARFSRQRFQDEFVSLVDRHWGRFQSTRR